MQDLQKMKVQCFAAFVFVILRSRLRSNPTTTPNAHIDLPVLFNRLALTPQEHALVCILTTNMLIWSKRLFTVLIRKMNSALHVAVLSATSQISFQTTFCSKRLLTCWTSWGSAAIQTGLLMCQAQQPGKQVLTSSGIHWNWWIR